MLSEEARALLGRLNRVKPYSLLMPMVHAAAISPAAFTAIERHMAQGRNRMRALVLGFLHWLLRGNGRSASPAEAQRYFALVRLRFNSVLSQFDIFADVLNQRSEHETGTWIAGLDAVATDALALPGYYETPPVVCYLDRGHGAAIRRARSRLPGGDPNPVAIIRVPRERMVGSGIASSLVHEVGHQGSSLLGLVESMHPILQGMQRKGGSEQVAWALWDRWISEILADFWSVARVGVASTLGLIGVVSLPRAFVFRPDLDDPHPIPWIRVKLSCAMGEMLYPHPQWAALSRLWEALYPRDVDSDVGRLLALLEGTIPAFVALLVHHRPARLRGGSLAEVVGGRDRQPAQLEGLLRLNQQQERLTSSAPTLAFAALGYAKVNGRTTPEADTANVARLLNHWALRSTQSPERRCSCT
jgi:hypothetical protein